MWPYWLEESGRAPNTVHNSLVAMDSMFLLTGACRCSWCRFSRFLAGLEIVSRSSSSSLNGVRCQRYRLVDVLSPSPLFLCSAPGCMQRLTALGADVSLNLKPCRSTHGGQEHAAAIDGGGGAAGCGGALLALTNSYIF